MKKKFPKLTNAQLVEVGKRLGWPLVNKKRSMAQKERWDKYRTYRQAFVNMGCTPMTKEEIKKSRATRPVDLHLTRKDAWYLREILSTSLWSKDVSSEEWHKSARRILNKLKREGVK